MNEYALFLFAAFVIACILIIIRRLQINTSLEKGVVEACVGWIIVTYGLILGFTISNFYNRYIEIRNIFIDETTNLRLTYNYFKDLPNNTEVILSIRKYVKSVQTYLGPSLANYEYSEECDINYQEMNTSITNYISKYPDNPYRLSILNRMSTDDHIKALTTEMKSGLYYIQILSFLIIFIIIPLYLINIESIVVQAFIDFCLFSIIFTGLYICTILNNPFKQSPITIQFLLYSDLLDSMQRDGN